MDGTRSDWFDGWMRRGALRPARLHGGRRRAFKRGCDSL